MRFLCLHALKDLRRMARDPVQLLVWIGIPVFVALAMYALFGRGEVKPRGLLLIADEDRSLLSRLAAGAFSQGPLGEMFQVEQVAREDGRRRMQSGQASALLVIPRGFGQAVLESAPARLELLKNPSQRILPEIAEEAVSVLADGAFYLQVLAGDQLRALAAGAPAEASAAAASVFFQRLAVRAARFLDPPVLSVKEPPGEPPEAASANLGAVFLPGLLIMPLLFLSQGLSADIWRESRGHTLRRVAVTPGGVLPLLAGKLLAFEVVVLAVTAAGLLAANRLAGLPVAMPAAALAWMAVAGAGIYALFLLAQTLAPGERAAQITSNVILFPLLMLGGSLFPFEAMPPWMAAIGRWTPNGQALTQWKTMLAGSAPPAHLAAIFGAAALLAAVAFSFAAARVPRRFLS